MLGFKGIQEHDVSVTISDFHFLDEGILGMSHMSRVQKSSISVFTLSGLEKWADDRRLKVVYLDGPPFCQCLECTRRGAHFHGAYPLRLWQIQDEVRTKRVVYCATCRPELEGCTVTAITASTEDEFFEIAADILDVQFMAADPIKRYQLPSKKTAVRTARPGQKGVRTAAKPPRMGLVLAKGG